MGYFDCQRFDEQASKELFDPELGVRGGIISCKLTQQQKHSRTFYLETAPQFTQRQIHTRTQASLRNHTALPFQTLVSEGPAMERRLFGAIDVELLGRVKEVRHRWSAGRYRQTKSTSIYLDVDSV